MNEELFNESNEIKCSHEETDRPASGEHDLQQHLFRSTGPHPDLVTDPQGPSGSAVTGSQTKSAGKFTPCILSSSLWRRISLLTWQARCLKRLLSLRKFTSH